MQFGERMLGFFAGLMGVAAVEHAWRENWWDVAICALIAVFFMLATPPLMKGTHPHA